VKPRATRTTLSCVDQADRASVNTVLTAALKKLKKSSDDVTAMALVNDAINDFGYFFVYDWIERQPRKSANDQIPLDVIIRTATNETWLYDALETGMYTVKKWLVDACREIGARAVDSFIRLQQILPDDTDALKALPDLQRSIAVHRKASLDAMERMGDNLDRRDDPEQLVEDAVAFLGFQHLYSWLLRLIDENPAHSDELLTVVSRATDEAQSLTRMYNSYRKNSLYERTVSDDINTAFQKACKEMGSVAVMDWFRLKRYITDPEDAHSLSSLKRFMGRKALKDIETTFSLFVEKLREPRRANAKKIKDGVGTLLKEYAATVRQMYEAGTRRNNIDTEDWETFSKNLRHALRGAEELEPDARNAAQQLFEIIGKLVDEPVDEPADEPVDEPVDLVPKKPKPQKVKKAKTAPAVKNSPETVSERRSRPEGNAQTESVLVEIYERLMSVMGSLKDKGVEYDREVNRLVDLYNDAIATRALKGSPLLKRTNKTAPVLREVRSPDEAKSDPVIAERKARALVRKPQHSPQQFGIFRAILQNQQILA
jgi:hypothetical protein